jgi:type II secretory pathway component PulF
LERFAKAKTYILDGGGVCSSFEKHQVFDGEFCDLLAIGEKVGDLASSFEDIHRMQDEQLQSTLKKLKISISAIAMLFAFSLIGILALGRVQSIMGASSVVS